MRKIDYILLALFFSVVTAGCSPQGAKTPKLLIQFPSEAESRASNKVGTSSFYDWSRACYIVNVTGPGIDEVKTQCEMPIGILAGTALPGGSVSLEVPQGANRKVEIFAYQRVASGDPCPPLSKASLGNLAKDRIVRVGQADNINVAGLDITVPVTVYSPSTGSNLLTQYGLPATCIAVGSVGPSSGQISSGHSVLQGTTLQITGSVGSSTSYLKMSGPSINIHAKTRGN